MSSEKGMGGFRNGCSKVKTGALLTGFLPTDANRYQRVPTGANGFLPTGAYRRRREEKRREEKRREEKRREEKRREEKIREEQSREETIG